TRSDTPRRTPADTRAGRPAFRARTAARRRRAPPPIRRCVASTARIRTRSSGTCAPLYRRLAASTTGRQSASGGRSLPLGRFVLVRFERLALAVQRRDHVVQALLGEDLRHLLAIRLGERDSLGDHVDRPPPLRSLLHHVVDRRRILAGVDFGVHDGMATLL